MTKNPYHVLQVDPRANDKVIHAAYRALALQLGEGNPGLADLNTAYASLKNAAEREKVDARLRQPDGKAILGNYRLLKKIAVGGTGTTYIAEHQLLGEKVCIKHALKPDPLYEDIIREEARALWNLAHHGIPAMKDVLRLDDGSMAIIMSYIPGLNLQQLVEKEGPRDPEELSRMVGRLLNVFGYLYDNKVVHGDVKPANIIPDLDNNRVTLVDFGFSLVKPAVDTPVKGYEDWFSSPEQKAFEPLLPESDLYSLGLTMIWALGGNVQARPLKVPKHVPDPLLEFITRLLARNPLKRPSWKTENLSNTFSDVRLAAFGRRESHLTPGNTK